MKATHLNREVQSQAERHNGREWILEIILFVMLAPAMIYDFISIGTFAGL